MTFEPYIPLFSFEPEKLTQAACVLLKLAGGKMEYIKLLKLLYLADRAALDELERPISGDDYVSMKCGPVLSNAYNMIVPTAYVEGRDLWDKHIAKTSRYDVSLINEFSTKDLCEAEEDILASVYRKYAHIPWQKLVDLTHTICPEWKDPAKSVVPVKALPLPTEDILEKLHKTPEDIERIENESWEQRRIEHELRAVRREQRNLVPA